jgi:hypothetical protein
VPPPGSTGGPPRRSKTFVSSSKGKHRGGKEVRTLARAQLLVTLVVLATIVALLGAGLSDGR